ncbi:hypothetical protein EB796_017409 [Bugula neritina]|uniref:Uncharacterized protein n=1 Tax=Bugula neritina TaxID=10212 RepID=A0A7J7JFX4_BUGNE|nr:hypothetical protein EB796_017409 [Bugula neritina]
MKSLVFTVTVLALCGGIFAYTGTTTTCETCITRHHLCQRGDAQGYMNILDQSEGLVYTIPTTVIQPISFAVRFMVQVTAFLGFEFELENEYINSINNMIMNNRQRA